MAVEKSVGDKYLVFTNQLTSVFLQKRTNQRYWTLVCSL